ncbi:AAA family ATPase [Candidatus Altiarchaeota archaeon]
MNREEYYGMLGWEKSPFIKSTSTDTPIVQRLDEYEQVCECIGGWDRIMILTAPIGYGKTTFMHQLKKVPPADIRYVISFSTYEPEEEVMERIKSKLPIWKRIFTKKVDRSFFGEYLHDKLGKDKMLLLFDEAQDYDEDLFKWLRTLNDNVDNIFMIFFGLTGLEDKITSETSFRDRKSKSITLQQLSKSHLKKIIESRIFWVGGEGIRPFTEQGLDRLCGSANNIPRLLLENGQKVIEYCARNDIEEVGSDIVEKILGGVEDLKIEQDMMGEDAGIEPAGSPSPQPSSNMFIDDLSPTQQAIIDLMMRHESLSISEISKMLDKDIRSVGSLIRKLRGLNDSEVKRKPHIPYPLVIRIGKETRMGRLQYIFTLSDHIRRTLAEK